MTWPERGDDYLDLCEAVERGALVGRGGEDVVCEPPGMRSRYILELDSWKKMRADLLSQLFKDAGSIRRAAKVLGVARSTLGMWHRRIEEERDG